MKLSSNAKVFMENGEHIGNLSRYVLDPKTKKVASLVIKRGLLEPTEYVLPIEWIDQVDEDGIHLKTVPFKKPEELTPFTEDKFIITDEHALLDKGYVGDDMISNYYYYPSLPFGTAGVMPPVETYTSSSSRIAPTPAQMGIPVEGEEPVIDETQENIPPGDYSLKEGARVLSQDEKHVGNVDKVIINPADNKMTHLVVSRGLLLKERKAVPVDWIDYADTDTVYLTVNSELLSHLPDYQNTES